MALRISQVDAFTDAAFSGNPAAVCILSNPVDDGWMQAVAMEMNLSETAFLIPNGEVFGLRWFTPALEVNLCGHATLASAHVLWEEGHLSRDQQARFSTRSGILTADLTENGIELCFPAVTQEAADAPEGLLGGLGVEAAYVGKNGTGYLVEVASEEILRKMTPDFTRLMSVDATGIIVTSKASTPGLDFVSRFFAPRSGVQEDPVTGSAHCTLGPYWRKQLGKESYTGYQASKRGGIVRLSLVGDRVHLIGNAVTVMRGELLIPESQKDR